MMKSDTSIYFKEAPRNRECKFFMKQKNLGLLGAINDVRNRIFSHLGIRTFAGVDRRSLQKRRPYG